MKKVVLLGDPVEHSLSPAMQNAAFRVCGLDFVYEAMRVAPDELPAAMAALRTESYAGANVTIPHKEAALRLADSASDLARRVGATNTLARRDTTLYADNTDVEGFRLALEERGVDVRGRQVLVLGAGGAARACVAALADISAEVDLTARRRERASALAAALSPNARTLEWLPGQLDAYALVVNTTPLGMHGEDPLAGLALPPGAAVFDLVPTAGETPLLRRARAAGCATIDGLVMLLHQAAASFRIWTGRAAPLDAMRAALPRRL